MQAEPTPDEHDKLKQRLQGMKLQEYLRLCLVRYIVLKIQDTKAQSELGAENLANMFPECKLCTNKQWRQGKVVKDVDPHYRIVECDRQFEEGRYAESCGQCGHGGTDMIVYQTKSGDTPESLRTEWLKLDALYKDVRTRSALTIANERDVWTRYCACVFDMAAPMALVPRNQYKPENFKMAEAIRLFVIDYGTRNVNGQSKSKVPLMPCLLHRNPSAHFVPHQGGDRCFDAYNPECGRCPKRTQPLPPRAGVYSTEEMVQVFGSVPDFEKRFGGKAELAMKQSTSSMDMSM